MKAHTFEHQEFEDIVQALILIDKGKMDLWKKRWARHVKQQEKDEKKREKAFNKRFPCLN